MLYRWTLTSWPDGTHLGSNSNPWRPAPANIATALHFGYGLWQLVRAAPVCQSRVAVTRANIWERNKNTCSLYDYAWDNIPLSQHLHASPWGYDRLTHECKLWEGNFEPSSVPLAQYSIRNALSQTLPLHTGTLGQNSTFHTQGETKWFKPMCQTIIHKVVTGNYS